MGRKNVLSKKGEKETVQFPMHRKCPRILQMKQQQNEENVFEG